MKSMKISARIETVIISIKLNALQRDWIERITLN